jgi:hypothetical protein
MLLITTLSSSFNFQTCSGYAKQVEIIFIKIILKEKSEYIEYTTIKQESLCYVHYKNSSSNDIFYSCILFDLD